MYRWVTLASLPFRALRSVLLIVPVTYTRPERLSGTVSDPGVGQYSTVTPATSVPVAVSSCQPVLVVLRALTCALLTLRASIRHRPAVGAGALVPGV